MHRGEPLYRVLRPGRGAWFVAEPLGDGTPLRLRGVAPGDVVRARPREDDPPWGDVVTLVEPANARRSPGCSLASACGGCHWLHIDEPAQRDLRLAALRERLEAAGHRDLPLPSRVLASPAATGYRCRARFQIDIVRGRIGFHAPGRTEVIDAPDCPLLTAEARRVYAPLRAWIKRARPEGLTGVEITALPAAAAENANDPLHGLVLLNPRDKPPPGWPALGAALLRDLPSVVSGVSVRPLRDDPRPRSVGRAHVVGRSPAGSPVAAANGGFVQVNLGAAEILAREVVRLGDVGPGTRVTELFAGSGFLSWRLAAAGGEVAAIENDPHAALAAKALPAAPAGSFRVAPGNAFARGPVPSWAGADVVVTDPPRSGLGPLATRLAEGGAPRLVHVACSIDALVRDLDALRAGGYRVVAMAAVDMFPQTRHLETIVALGRSF